jgi:hypothetical protein
LFGGSKRKSRAIGILVGVEKDVFAIVFIVTECLISALPLKKVKIDATHSLAHLYG